MTNAREKLLDALARAIAKTPQLWLYEISEDEWHVCRHGVDGEIIVVREAASQDEAAEKRDQEIKRMRAEAAITAIERAGGWAPPGHWIAPWELTEEMEAEMGLGWAAKGAWEGARDAAMRTAALQDKEPQE